MLFPQVSFNTQVTFAPNTPSVTISKCWKRKKKKAVRGLWKTQELHCAVKHSPYCCVVKTLNSFIWLWFAVKLWNIITLIKPKKAFHLMCVMGDSIVHLGLFYTLWFLRTCSLEQTRMRHPCNLSACVNEAIEWLTKRSDGNTERIICSYQTLNGQHLIKFKLNRWLLSNQWMYLTLSHFKMKVLWAAALVQHLQHQ